MPVLSALARKKKIEFFLKDIPEDALTLEIGCGSGWVREYLAATGRTRYLGIDLVPPAEIVGDIREWKKLGLAEGTIDYIIAFEVVEHVDCFEACYELLKPGGKLLLTSPLPRMDWFLRLLEALHLNQKRTSPHDHLIDFRRIPLFKDRQIKVVAGLAQWGVLTR